jgi:hypothetical protein
VDLKASRQRLETALTDARPDGLTGLLVGWVVIAEWVDEQGDAWLARFNHDGCTAWQRTGYLQHALEDWGEGEEEEEE